MKVTISDNNIFLLKFITDAFAYLKEQMVKKIIRLTSSYAGVIWSPNMKNIKR